MAMETYNLQNQDPGRTPPRDFFLHLLTIVTLYIVAGSFIALIFRYIDVLFPDPLQSDLSGLAAQMDLLP